MIEKREITDFLGIYPWNSETLTIDVPQKEVKEFIRKTLEYIATTHRGREFLEYIRGRRECNIQGPSDVWEYPVSDPEALIEWLRLQMTPEDIFQLGFCGLLVPRLWAECVKKDLESGNIDGALDLTEDIEIATFGEQAILEFKEIPGYEALHEKYLSTPGLEVLWV